jgi:peptide/nickel transport system permease protein
MRAEASRRWKGAGGEETMGRYVIRRLIGIPPLLIGITLIVFAIVHLTPGSPVDDLRLNPEIKESDLIAIKKTLGIDKPLWQQYTGWIGQLVRGDFGISLKTYRPVRSLIFQRLPNTLLLTGTALLFSLCVAIPIGVLSALKRNSLFDYIATIMSTLLDSIPGFWLGLILIILFAVQLRWLPSGGTQTLPNGGGFLDHLKHLILPVITISGVQIALWVRYIRAQMLEVLNQDYVRTARAKGLPETSVNMRHAFRNALLPLITLIGFSIPGLFGGAIITERVFGWPGIGSLLIDGASNRDYTQTMGVTIFLATIVVFANLLADIAYGIADPRVQFN